MSDSESEEKRPKLFRKYPMGRQMEGEDTGLDTGLPSDAEFDDSDDELPSDPEDINDDNNMKFKANKNNKPEKKEPPLKVPVGGFRLPSSEEQPKVWVLVGTCGSGKTWMLKSIMYQHAVKKHFKFGVVYTATKFTGDYTWSPDRSVRAWDEEHFKGYIENLKTKTEQGVAKEGKDFKLPHNYVIFDDNNGILTQSEFMINFISTHRHTRTTVFILSQLLTSRGSVSTTMRANTSFALMWPTPNHKNIKGLYENFGGSIESFKEFKDKLFACRQRPHSCLVLKNSIENTTPEEEFTTIVAAPFPKDFQLKF